MHELKYWLANVEDRAELHSSFFIPDEKDRYLLPLGVYVKLIYEFLPETQGNCGERLWIKVMGRGDMGYVGLLMNQPVYIPLKIGDWIAFGPEHIASIIYELEPEISV